MHRLPFLVLHAHEEVVAGDAGVVDEDVEPAHRGLGRRHQRLDRVLVGEIRRDDVDALAEVGRERVERRAPRAGERDRRALRMQRPRDRPADAAGRAGDEGLPAGEIEHGALPPGPRRCRTPIEKPRRFVQRGDRGAVTP